jgi:hypothetical protein
MFAYSHKNQRKDLFINFFTNTEENFSQTQQIYTLPVTMAKVYYLIQKHSQKTDATLLLDRIAST